MKYINTPMFKRYILKFILRITIFLCVLYLYLFNKNMLLELINTPIKYGVTLLHIIWLIFVFIMLTHLFPKEKLSMALLKAEKNIYETIENYSELALHKYIQNQNIKALTVMLLWLILNSIFGLLYAFKLINEADLYMLTVFYFLSDYICILIYCPFQSHIMNNKCCVNCRIYDWGHFMMFTPMIFIRSFYTWSLFFLSCIVLIRWEIIYARHPERFWSGSNKNLQCQHCRDKTCQIKNKIKSNK